MDEKTEMDNNFRIILYIQNGSKLDEEYFKKLFFINGGSFDQESQNLFNYFLFSQPKQTEKKDPPSAKEQSAVFYSSPAVAETVECSSCGEVIDRNSKFCQACGKKLERNADTECEPARILWGEALYKGLCNLIYSAPGGFKSMLSKFIGALRIFHNCLYIIVDSSNSIDLSSYRKTLGEKAIIISQKMFEDKVDGLEDTKRWKIFLESMLVFNLPAKQYHEGKRFEEILCRVKRKYNSGNNVSKIDEITILQEIIREAIKMGTDFICIDSLNALIGDSRRLHRKSIKRILQPARENGVTLLCLHHTNKAGIIAGSSGISEEFDYVCRLSNDTTATRLERNERRLVLTEEKARYSIPQAYHIKVVFGDGPNPKFELVYREDYSEDNYPSNALNLPNLVKNILSTWECDTITFRELLSQVREVKPATVEGSVTNALTTLSRKDIVQKTNGSWAIITILKK